MGSIGQSASASLPTLGFKEQSSAQPFGNYGTSSVFAPSSQHSMQVGAGCQSQPEPQQRAGRKRSRDEAGINLEDNDLFRQAVSASLELGQSAGNGQGTTLFGPNGSLVDSGSEKRSCADDAAAYSLPVPLPLTAPMPILRSHKSQRMDLGNVSSKAEEGNGWTDNTPSSSPTRQSPKRGPTVDDYTMHLGIGWSRISNDVDMQAAARGWAKYIENHFHIGNPKILLQSNGLASYLVEATEGWFLFGEDLAQGRLVATSLDRTFENLRTSPPVFDGGEVLVPVAEPAKASANATHEDMVDEPHVYAGSMNRRKEYLNSAGMMVADGARSHTLNRQDPDDGMDMS
ncbi:hypothetical protein V493_06897 [Pseudogymnoascus sp. VKM F-4281 (FW-2241)]|nr:hypothetical protein V493_06897 [Pseudogymnoascus sp. VKM F-4281 (FW-2241)]